LKAARFSSVTSRYTGQLPKIKKINHLKIDEGEFYMKDIAYEKEYKNNINYIGPQNWRLIGI